MPKKRFVSGVVDPITLIGVLFLIITLAVGTYVVADRKYNFNIFEKAAVLEGEDFNYLRANRAELDQKIKERKEEIEQEEKAEKSEPAPVATTTPKTCSIDGTPYNEGSVVVSGGQTDLKKCNNGSFVDCPTCNIAQLTTVPAYLQDEYNQALQNVAEKLEREELSISGTNVVQEQRNKIITEIGSQIIQKQADQEIIPVGRSICAGDERQIWNGDSWDKTKCSGGCNSGACISTQTFVDGGTNGEPVYSTATTYDFGLGRVQTVTSDPYTVTSNNSVEKTDEGFDRNLTTIVRNYDTKDIINIESIPYYNDQKWMVDYNNQVAYLTSAIRNKNTDEILNLVTQNIATLDTRQQPLFSVAKNEYKYGSGLDITYNPTIYNFADCHREGLTQEQSANCDKSLSEAYNLPIVGRYIQAYDPQNVEYTGQEFLGIRDYVLTKEQIGSSVALGTTLTAAGAIVTSPLAYGVGAITGTQAISLGFAGMTTLQTGTAVDICTINPGSPECYYNAGMALVSWTNIASSANLARAIEAGQGIQTASAINTAVNVGNIGVDIWDITQSCGDGQFASTSNCAGAWLGTVFDVGQGAADFGILDAIAKNLDLSGITNNPLSEINYNRVPALDVSTSNIPRGIDPNLVTDVFPDASGNRFTVEPQPEIAGLLGAGDTPIAIDRGIDVTHEFDDLNRAMATVENNPPPTSRWQDSPYNPTNWGLGGSPNADPVNSVVDGVIKQELTEEGQAFANIDLGQPKPNALYDTEGSPNRTVVPIWLNNTTDWIVNNITQPIAIRIWGDRAINTSSVETIVRNNIYTPTTPLTTRIGDWVNRNIGDNPIINKLIGRPEDISIRPDEVATDELIQRINTNDLILTDESSLANIHEGFEARKYIFKKTDLTDVVIDANGNKIDSYEVLLEQVQAKIRNGQSPLEAVNDTLLEAKQRAIDFAEGEHIDLNNVEIMFIDKKSLSSRILCGTSGKIDCLETPIIQEFLLFDAQESMGFKVDETAVIIGFGGNRGKNDFSFRHGALVVGDQIVGYNLIPRPIGVFQRYANVMNWGEFFLTQNSAEKVKTGIDIILGNKTVVNPPSPSGVWDGVKKGWDNFVESKWNPRNWGGGGSPAVDITDTKPSVEFSDQRIKETVFSRNNDGALIANFPNGESQILRHGDKLFDAYPIAISPDGASYIYEASTPIKIVGSKKSIKLNLFNTSEKQEYLITETVAKELSKKSISTYNAPTFETISMELIKNGYDPTKIDDSLLLLVRNRALQTNGVANLIPDGNELEKLINPLVKNLTGKTIGDPELPTIIDEASQKIRLKYGLPDDSTKFDNPNAYKNELETYAASKGIIVKDIFEHPDPNFFKNKAPHAGGVAISPKESISGKWEIYYPRDNADLSPSLKNEILDHEIVHTQQDPKTPFEVKEWEAYLVQHSGKSHSTRESQMTLFASEIYSSTKFDYEYSGKEIPSFENNSSNTGFWDGVKNWWDNFTESDWNIFNRIGGGGSPPVDPVANINSKLGETSDPIKIAEESISAKYNTSQQKYESAAGEGRFYPAKMSTTPPGSELELKMLERIKGIKSVNEIGDFRSAISNENRMTPISNRISEAKSIDEIKLILEEQGFHLEIVDAKDMPEDFEAVWFPSTRTMYLRKADVENRWYVTKARAVHEATHADKTFKEIQIIKNEGTGIYSHDSELRDAIRSIGDEDWAYANQSIYAISELKNNKDLTANESKQLQETIEEAIKAYNWVVFGDVLPKRNTLSPSQRLTSELKDRLSKSLPPEIKASFGVNQNFPYDLQIRGKDNPKNPIDRLLAGVRDSSEFNQFEIGPNSAKSRYVIVIRDIGTKPEATGQGSGKILLDAIEKSAREMGIDTIVAENIFPYNDVYKQSNINSGAPIENSAYSFWLNQGYQPAIDPNLGYTPTFSPEKPPYAMIKILPQSEISSPTQTGIFVRAWDGVKNWWEGLKQSDNKIIQFFINPKERGSLGIPNPFYDFAIEIPLGRNHQSELFSHLDTISGDHGKIIIKGPDIYYQDTKSLNGSFYRNSASKPFTKIKTNQKVKILPNTEIMMADTSPFRVEVQNSEIDAYGKTVIIHNTKKSISEVVYKTPEIKLAPSSAQTVSFKNNGSGLPKGILWNYDDRNLHPVPTYKISGINNVLLSETGGGGKSVDDFRLMIKNGSFNTKSDLYFNDPVTGYELPDGTIYIESGRHKAQAMIEEGFTEIPMRIYTINNQKISGQTLLEFSAALPVVIAIPAAGLYYLDQYLDLGVTDYLLYSIDNALDNEQKPKRITDPAYDSINFWLNSAAIVYGLNSNKELSEIAISNPNQRPYDEIIQEAIDNYTENNPDSDVYYESNPHALSLIDVLKKLFSQDSIDILSSTINSEEYEKLTFSGKIMNLSNKLITNRDPFIKSVTGAAGNIGLFTKDGGTYPIDGFNQDVKNLIVLIEEEVQNTGQPVSHSFVIEYFLEKNNGDLAQAILDSSNFEELLVRSLNDNFVNEPYIWIQDHITDEYSPLLPYQLLPKQEEILENSVIYYDYSLPNRLGEIYHAASITALLNYLPPEIIRGMVISEYLSYGKKHGLIKLSSDLEVLRQLDNINDLLKSYE